VEVLLEEVLHLKTGVNYLENNNLLVSGEFTDKPEFASFRKTVIPEAGRRFKLSVAAVLAKAVMYKRLQRLIFKLFHNRPCIHCKGRGQGDPVFQVGDGCETRCAIFRNADFKSGHPPFQMSKDMLCRGKRAD